MTREEAIRRIECCRDFLANNYSDMGEPNFTAFNMAIKALSQEPTKREIEREYLFQSLCEDFKKLQAENDNLKKRLEQEPCKKCVYSTKDGYCQYDDISETIPPLGSCDDTISRSDMFDAIGHGTTYTSEELQRIIQNLPPVNPQLCEDAISRDELLKAIDTWDKFGYTETGCFVRITKEIDNYVPYVHLEDVITAIQKLPPVTQKSGKWIDYRDDGFVECPICGHATNCYDDIDELHYCFYCGAKMVEPQERSDKE